MKISVSPKTRFLKTDAAKQHQELVASSLVQESVEVALAEMAVQQSAGGTLEEAARKHNLMEGAKQFAHIWLNLSIQAESPKKPRTDNLEER